jgi:hypothetical protein
MSSDGVVRTKMADAMLKALNDCNAEGRNPRRVGRRILTNKFEGVGVIMRTPKKKPKADAAV